MSSAANASSADDLLRQLLISAQALQTVAPEASGVIEGVLMSAADVLASLLDDWNGLRGLQ